MDIFTKIENQKTRFILSAVSAVIFHLVYDLIMITGNFTVYFLSYIRYKQTWVDINYGNLMRPVVLLALSIFSPLSGVLEHFFGIRIAVFIGAFIVEIGFVLLYFQRNIWHFYSLTVLLGIGTGLSSEILVKNACCYYPDKKGLISSSIASIGTLVSSGYSILGEFMINPERVELKGNNETYYEESIAERSRTFFLSLMIIIPIITLLSLFLLYTYSPECEINTRKIEDEIKGPMLEEENEESKEDNNSRRDVSNSFSKSTYKSNIMKAIKRWRFWRNTLIMGLMPYIIYFEESTSRPYSSILGVDTTVIGFMAGSTNILGCLINPIWAFGVDKFGFQPVIKIIASLIIFVSIYFCIFMGNKVFYVIGLYISCTLRGGILSSFIPHIMHIFGLKYFLIIGGLGRLFTQLIGFSAGLVSIIISIFRKGLQLTLPYRIVCIFSLGFAIFGLFLSFYENDDKFQFDEEGENKDKEEKHEELQTLV